MVFAGVGAVLLALLREDDVLFPGETVSSLNNTAVNHVGGYACSLSSTGSGTTISRIWGEPSGGMGMLMRSEMTIGVFQQTSFESFYGMGDAGELGYGTTSTNIDSGETGLDGVWLDDLAVLHEEDPVPSLPGMWSNFNSRPTSTGDGTLVWVGGFADDPDASTQNRALFSGLGASVLIMGGDFLPGIAEPIKMSSSNIDFDFRVSRFGTNWIDQVLVDTGSSSNDGVMVINGVPIMSGGGRPRSAVCPTRRGTTSTSRASTRPATSSSPATRMPPAPWMSSSRSTARSSCGRARSSTGPASPSRSTARSRVAT
jgi:hypothetical protein